MGMRSDLAKELKNLLNSDIIKGKVTVQRAYADWRRYPQYIVPLSEASIDLIFAPAYGSSKKNATDIRMAIDGMELVFIRPEIGTYILLTGDSDFSSLVLKLKEYGKYVIGIGIQESSSDILVQNCDEYYSYTSIAGLRKTTDQDTQALDPWECVAEAVKRMVERGDVMRSDRLKQVMLEISPNFDERNLGFKKFSKFLAEAAGKGLVTLRRGENGQYEVGPSKDSGGGEGGGRSRGRSRASERRDSGASRSRGGRRDRRDGRESQADAPAASSDAVADGLATLHRTMTRLHEDGKEAVRDSDVKRKILSLEPDFNEVPLGFPKFSKFLAYAEEQGVIALERLETGNFRVRLAEGALSAPDVETTDAEAPDVGAPESTGAEGPVPDEVGESTTGMDIPSEAPTSDEGIFGGALGLRNLFGRLGPRRGEKPRHDVSDGPIIDPDQTREPSTNLSAGSTGLNEGPDHLTLVDPDPPVDDQAEAPPAQEAGSSLDYRALGLPTTSDSMISYLANRYRGVGEKTAEALVQAFGPELFNVFHTAPERVQGVVGEGRAEQVLEAWREDYGRRAQTHVVGLGSPQAD